MTARHRCGDCRGRFLAAEVYWVLPDGEPADRKDDDADTYCFRCIGHRDGCEAWPDEDAGADAERDSVAPPVQHGDRGTDPGQQTLSVQGGGGR